MSVPTRPPVTVVVGAGPAGLLFCIVARLQWAAAGRQPTDWPIVLVDRRDTYSRTHRLRIDPRPFRRMQADLASPIFDRLVDFLDANDFGPDVNRLESFLEDLAAQLGIRKRLAAVGDGDGELDLAGLRAWLEADGLLSSEAPVSVVGADGVHSAVRRLVAGPWDDVREVHQVVARLRVEGPGLPDQLGYVEQFKLAKVIGSALDYRRNSNGFAEIDLFLPPVEHEAIERLGATPADPLRADLVAAADAPLFARIVADLREGFGAGPCTVHIQSTFRLEHRCAMTAGFTLTDLNMQVFLVGDAAISLPFFRGMAALAEAVDRLATSQVGWAERVLEGEPHVDQTEAYTAQLREVCARELEVVRARARLVARAREFVRLASLVPFPIQQWLLDRHRPRLRGGHPTPALFINAMWAAAVLVVGLGAPLAGGLVAGPIGWLWLLALPLQFLGGGIYRATVLHESDQNPWLAAVWRIQLFILLVGGIAATALSTWRAERPAQLFGALGWFFLGLAFAAGMLTYERLAGRDQRIGAAEPH